MTTLKFPTFTSIDLSNFDLSNIEMPKFEMPKFNVPKVAMPKVAMPKVAMPKVNVPTIDGGAVTSVAKDAAYIAIGLAVLTIQKVQVQRRELTKSIRAQARRTTTA